MEYKFKQYSDTNDRALICPQCREVLHRVDIEFFTTCPYCSFPLETTGELEDFLLEPIVDVWTATEQKRML
jgi:uncharacterized CHY-type Zn-finger protein